MSREELAINGGPRTLDVGRAERKAQLKRGVARSLDLMTMLPLTLRGVTSIQNASGIVARFQEAFANYAGAKYALAMNSGTSTIHSAYMAVGVGPGSEVIVPAYTWHASASPILQCGAVPVFCDIDPATLAADPDDVERRITERTRAICVLHPWGNPAPMDRFMEIAERHGVAVIEDCSHAHGGSYLGKGVGTWGHVGCFSLQGSKSVEGGEAGVATTDDPVLYDRMLLLGHNHIVGGGGQKAATFDVPDSSLGVKYRPHTAAMYLAYRSLKRLPARNQRGAQVWKMLCDGIEGLPGIRPQATLEGAERGGWYSYILEYTGQDLGGPSPEEFVEALKSEGAPVHLDQYRDTLLHRTPLFDGRIDRSQLGGGCWDATRPWQEQIARGSLPVSERVAPRLVRFPIGLQDLPDDAVRGCAQALKKVLTALVPAAAEGLRPEAAAVSATG